MTAMTSVPVHPFWKRAIAGTLDFLGVYTVAGWFLHLTVGNIPFPSTSSGTTFSIALRGGGGFEVQSWTALILIALVIAYFIVLRRTGGTVFQRIFRINSSKV